MSKGLDLLITTARQSEGVSFKLITPAALHNTLTQIGLELLITTARQNKDGAYDLNLFEHHGKAKQGWRFGFELLCTKKASQSKSGALDLNYKAPQQGRTRFELWI